MTSPVDAGTYLGETTGRRDSGWIDALDKPDALAARAVVARLMWRITTNGRLGATHTLGEFADNPQLATDASGRTVAVWLADLRSGDRGVVIVVAVYPFPRWW